MILGNLRNLGWIATILGASCVAIASARPSLGDEPGRFRLSKLFRLGSRSGSNPAPKSVEEAAPLPGPAPSIATSTTAPNTSNGPSPRILPQPRESRSVSDAEPILVRVALIRADDGKQFGEFMQVFADGTVIDSEGVHRATREALRGLVDALRDADAARAGGHCGAPSTDFIEQVHLTVFDHSFGRLRANHFSYSGNPQGCDPSIRRLHAAIESFLVRLRTPVAANSTPRPASLAPNSAVNDPRNASDSAPPPPSLDGPSIPLTPEP